MLLSRVAVLALAPAVFGGCLLTSEPVVYRPGPIPPADVIVADVAPDVVATDGVVPPPIDAPGDVPVDRIPPRLDVPELPDARDASVPPPNDVPVIVPDVPVRVDVPVLPDVVVPPDAARCAPPVAYACEMPADHSCAAYTDAAARAYAAARLVPCCTDGDCSDFVSGDLCCPEDGAVVPDEASRCLHTILEAAGHLGTPCPAACTAVICRVTTGARCQSGVCVPAFGMM